MNSAKVIGPWSSIASRISASTPITGSIRHAAAPGRMRAMAGVQEPRPAATVIAARQGPEGVEVLVLQRGSRSRFLPGYVVFPGGAVDPADVEHAARWFGTSAEAARACAIRELSEEAGLVLTADGLRAAACGELGPVGAAPPRAEQPSALSPRIAPGGAPGGLAA